MDRREVEVEGQSIGGERFAVIAGPCTVESREIAAGDRRLRQRGGRDLPARRRVQAPQLAPLLPGAGPCGAPAPRRGPGADRAAGGDRGAGRPRRRGRGRGGGRRAGGRSEHAELPAADRARPRRAPRAAQARAVGHAGRAADGCRVRHTRGQPGRDPVRAGDPHLRDRLPLHARPDGRAGAQGAQRAAGRGRPQPRRGPARAGGADVPGGRGRRCRRRDRGGPSRPDERRVRRPAVPELRRVRLATSAGSRG